MKLAISLVLDMGHFTTQMRPIHISEKKDALNILTHQESWTLVTEFTHTIYNFWKD